MFNSQHEWAASVWAVMARFGNTVVLDELNGPEVHRLDNVMTLSLNEHRYFDHLLLWLESTVSFFETKVKDQ